MYMKKIYSLPPSLPLLLTPIFTVFWLTSFSQKASIPANDIGNGGKTQLFVNVNYVPKASDRYNFLRKGFFVNAGIIKPIYKEISDDFSRVLSLTASVGYGQNEADGALQDIENQINPVAFAIIGSLSPSFTSAEKRAGRWNVGIGLREDFSFKRLGFGLAVIAGYQDINRPAFSVIDNNLTGLRNGDKIVYARSEAVSAEGLFFKPSFDVNYWLDSRLSVYASVDYTFGSAFKGNQIIWNAESTDGDAYLSQPEIRAGRLSAQSFEKPVNMLSAGIGFRYAIGK